MNASDPESIQFLRNQRARIQFFSITQPTPGWLFCSSVVREAGGKNPLLICSLICRQQHLSFDLPFILSGQLPQGLAA